VWVAFKQISSPCFVDVGFSSSIVGLTTVKRDKYSVFNFLNFPTHEDIEPDQQHHSNQASAPADKGRELCGNSSHNGNSQQHFTHEYFGFLLTIAG